MGMQKRYLYVSVLFHLAIFLLCAIDVPFWKRKPLIDEQPVIIVDLSDIKISDTTNLPQKAVLGEEKKEATRKEKPNQEIAKKVSPPKQEEIPVEEPVKEEIKEQEIKSPSLIEKTPKFEEKKEEPKKESEKKKENKKTAPIPQRKPEIKKEKKAPAKKTTPPKSSTPPKANTESNKKDKVNQASSLASLFADIEKRQKKIGEEDRDAQVLATEEVNNMGVEGGNAKGSYFSELSISNIDYVKSKIQEKWTTTIGGADDRNIEVLINVVLAENGDIISVKVVDKLKYNSNNYFRALADSAERAIRNAQITYNVFNKLAESNQASYGDWKEIKFTFTPLGLAK